MSLLKALVLRKSLPIKPVPGYIFNNGLRTGVFLDNSMLVRKAIGTPILNPLFHSSHNISPIFGPKKISHHSSRDLSTSQIKSIENKEQNESPPAKPGLIARFKQLCKDYWYVIVPVHASTSIVWFGSFYILVKSGVDVTVILSGLGVSEAYLEKIANSEWSYVALASACYKLASPARYTVTVGASTFAVKYLKEWGYLRTTKEVAHDFKVKIDDVEDKVKVRWQAYREGRRRIKAKKMKKPSKLKKE